MKVHVKDGEHNISLRLPTGLVFSRGTLWLVNHAGRKYAPDAMKNLSGEAMKTLFAELRSIKRKYGHWDLVEMKNADGTEILIQL